VLEAARQIAELMDVIVKACGEDDIGEMVTKGYPFVESLDEEASGVRGWVFEMREYPYKEEVRK
jgi:hypothetical protein